MTLFLHSTECDNGLYGNNCQALCHCKNDEACNKRTGHCINGCDIMWGGDFCSECEYRVNFMIIFPFVITSTY